MLVASLRIQTNPENKGEFGSVSHERYVLDLLFSCCLALEGGCVCVCVCVCGDVCGRRACLDRFGSKDGEWKEDGNEHWLTRVNTRAFADFVLGSLILHFFCVNFIN